MKAIDKTTNENICNLIKITSGKIKECFFVKNDLIIYDSIGIIKFFNLKIYDLIKQIQSIGKDNVKIFYFKNNLFLVEKNRLYLYNLEVFFNCAIQDMSSVNNIFNFNGDNKVFENIIASHMKSFCMNDYSEDNDSISLSKVFNPANIGTL